MKKKRILGIVTAMLMVIALALTGCGQQSGEQSAGATGSGDENGSVSEPNYKPEKADENAEDIGGNDSFGETDNKKPAQDADGNYVYLITVDGVQTEIKTCVNVWDYITSDAPYDHVDLNKMLSDLGWSVIEGGTGTGAFTYDDGSCIKITPWLGMSEYDLSTGENRVYGYTVAPWKNSNLSQDISIDIICESITEKPYVVTGTNDYVSFDEIVAYAHLVDAFRGSPEPDLAFEDNARIP